MVRNFSGCSLEIETLRIVRLPPAYYLGMAAFLINHSSVPAEKCSGELVVKAPRNQRS